MTKRTKRILAMMSSKPKLRKISGLPPLTYTAKEEGTLKNYRIYGQTVDGESVGDRTGNLFDGEIESGSWNIDKQPCLKIVTNTRMRNANFIKVDENSTYSITLSSEKNVSLLIHFLDAQCNYISETTWQNNILNFNTPSQCEYINIIFKKGNNEVMALSDISNIMLNAGSTPLPYEPYGYKVPVTVEGKNLYKISTFRDGSTSAVVSAVTFTINNNAVSISGISSAQHPQVTSQRFELISGETYSAKIFVDGSYDGKIYIMMHGGERQDGSDEINYKRINVGSGDTFVAKTYNSIIYVAEGTNKEFNAIVRVILIKGSMLPDTYEPYHTPITTPIYLPEQIRKVGDEAEYIEYGTQKMYRIGADDLDVTLPVLPTIRGTNVLSVETEVNPSKVEVTGRIRPVPTGGGE